VVALVVVVVMVVEHALEHSNDRVVWDCEAQWF
jgi:hypothetical protein